MSKKIKLILLLVWFFAALVYHCSHSKADEAPDPALFPIPTLNPNPDDGYQDYLNMLSALPVFPTPEPSLPFSADPPLFNQDGEYTPDPFLYTPSPSAEPFPVPTDARYQYYLFDSLRNEFTDGSSWYPNVSTLPAKSATAYRNGFRLTNVNLSNSWCVLDDSSDYFELSFFTRKLDFPSGYSANINLNNRWITFEQLAAFTDLSSPSLDISAVFTFTFNDLTQYSDTVVLTVDEFKYGFSYSFVNDRSSPLSVLRVDYIIKNANPVLDDGSIVPIALKSGNNHQTSTIFFNFFGPSNSNSGIEEQTSAIGGFFKSLLSGITKLFIPDEAMITDFINSSVQGIDGSPLSVAWGFTVRWLSILANPDDSLPSLEVPSYNITVNGSSYQLIPSYTVDFSSIPENLLTYSRMIGDFVLALAFLKYLSNKFALLFNIKFADTALEIDTDPSPSLFE